MSASLLALIAGFLHLLLTNVGLASCWSFRTSSGIFGWAMLVLINMEMISSFKTIIIGVDTCIRIQNKEKVTVDQDRKN